MAFNPARVKSRRPDTAVPMAYGQIITTEHLEEENKKLRLKYPPSRPIQVPSPQPSQAEGSSQAPVHLSSSSSRLSQSSSFTASNVPLLAASVDGTTPSFAAPDAAWINMLKECTQLSRQDETPMQRLLDRLWSIAQNLYNDPGEKSAAFACIQIVPIARSAAEHLVSAARLRGELEKKDEEIEASRQRIVAHEQEIARQLQTMRESERLRESRGTRKRTIDEISPTEESRGRARRRREMPGSAFSSNSSPDQDNQHQQSEYAHEGSNHENEVFEEEHVGGSSDEENEENDFEQDTEATMGVERQKDGNEERDCQKKDREVVCEREGGSEEGPVQENESTEGVHESEAETDGQVTLPFRCGVYVETADGFQVRPLQQIVSGMIPVIQKQIPAWKKDAARKGINEDTLFDKDSKHLKSTQCFSRAIIGVGSNFYIDQKVEEAKQHACKFCTRNGHPCMHYDKAHGANYDLVLTTLAPEFREGIARGECGAYVGPNTTDWQQKYKYELQHLFGTNGRDKRRKETARDSQETSGRSRRA